MIEAQNALHLFRAGNDTSEVAKRMRIPESKASRLIWIARCQEKKFPALWLDKARHERRAAA